MIAECVGIAGRNAGGFVLTWSTTGNSTDKVISLAYKTGIIPFLMPYLCTITIVCSSKRHESFEIEFFINTK